MTMICSHGIYTRHSHKFADSHYIMQLHELKSQNKSKKSKRVGRGGKRGTYSGHGMKGQKSRAGHRIRPGFRGGDTPFWKLFPKQRGSSKKVEVKHAKFQVHHIKPVAINLSLINSKFNDGDNINAKTLVRKQLIATGRNGIKILSEGKLDKKLKFSGNMKYSKVALVKIENSGSTVEVK